MVSGRSETLVLLSTPRLHHLSHRQLLPTFLVASPCLLHQVIFLPSALAPFMFLYLRRQETHSYASGMNKAKQGRMILKWCVIVAQRPKAEQRRGVLRLYVCLARLRISMRRWVRRCSTHLRIHKSDREYRMWCWPDFGILVSKQVFIVTGFDHFPLCLLEVCSVQMQTPHCCVYRLCFECFSLVMVR